MTNTEMNQLSWPILPQDIHKALSNIMAYISLLRSQLSFVFVSGIVFKMLSHSVYNNSTGIHHHEMSGDDAEFLADSSLFRR